MGLGGTISRQHHHPPRPAPGCKAKRILIEPKSMSARHHLALSVDHRTTPLTLSIAPPPTLSKQSPPSLHGLGPLWTTALRVVPRVQKGSDQGRPQITKPPSSLYQRCRPVGWRISLLKLSSSALHIDWIFCVRLF